MRILGIDPGLRACGVAEHHDGVWRTETIRPQARDLVERVREILDHFRVQIGLPDLVVIELPQVYQGHLQKGDPNDLIKLAVLVGAITALFICPVLLPTPTQWKNAVPKEIHHRRIRAKLPELGRCSKDAMDAVGLCLYGMERQNEAKNEKDRS
jgi:hypothetical protein